MTLHWWMHWFWVTAQIAGILANPLPSTTQDLKIPESLGESTVNSNSRNDRVSTMTDPRSTTNETIDETLINPSKNEARVSSNGSSFRVAKAINSHDSPTKTNTAIANNNNNDNLANEETTDIEITTRGESTPVIDHLTERNFRDNFQRTLRKNRGSMFKGDDEDLRTNGDSSTISNEPDSRITWLLTTNKTPDRRRKKNEDLTSRVNVMENFSNVKLDNDNEHDNNNDNNNNNSDNENNDDLTVLPLRIEGARFKLVLNSTHTITANSADGFSTRTFNGSEDIEIDQELAEPRLSATAASIIQAGISESTRLSRARNAFTSDFQRDHREEDLTSGIDVNRVIVEGNESINREIEKSSSSPSLIDIAAITGSCLATIVILSTMASLGFIMYRRKYLNPPQTLNSDKCSNPDSSGYIDDSTIRDNSEEMYSLDNDSFLNSLEAMTIQNYWTDSVKHTKL